VSLTKRDNSPTTSTTNTTAISPDLPALVRSDFPNVKYWTRREWKDHLLARRSVTVFGESDQDGDTKNASMSYVEDKDGIPVTCDRATSIRKFAREIWTELLGNGKAPTSWSKVGLTAGHQYRSEMKRRYPELQLCEGDWKSELIATENYPSWYSSKRPTKVKKEDQPDTAAPPAKRPLQTTESQSPKKKKIDESPLLESLNLEQITTDGPTPKDSQSTIEQEVAIPRVINPLVVPKIANPLYSFYQLVFLILTE